MNPPPALVAAFVARIDRVLEHQRAELRPGDVLVYRAPFWNTIPGELAPLPPADQRYTLEPGRMPVPLTVAEALATVTAAREDLAAAFAAELANAVFLLVPEPLQAGALEDPAVIAAWLVRVPGFPGGDWRADVSPAGPVEALSHLLERVPTLPGEPPVKTRPATLPAVAAWARPAHLAGVYLPPPTRWGVLTTNYDPPPTVPAVGLTALYRHLWARSPLFAVMQAGRIVGDLVSDEGNRAWLAAVDAALTPAAGEPDALADEARADVARRGGYAGALVAAANTVASAVFQDPPPVDDDAARETTGNPPALLWDRRFAAELARLGGARAPDVLALAVERATSGADLWHLWAPVDGPPRWLRSIARELWLSLWKPALERERLLPAVTTRIGRATVRVLSPATLERPTAEGVELVMTTGEIAGRVELDAIKRSLFARGGGSVVPADEARRAATELVRARATTAAVFAFLHAIRTVTALARRGGGMQETWETWNAWVDEVAACYDVKPTPDLRRLLCNVAWFGHAVQVPLFDGRTQRGLWTLNAPDPFKRGKPDPTIAREVAFSYAQIFDPKWAARENASDHNRGVRLMAIPDRLPVGVSNPAIRGSLYLFTLDVLAEVTMAPDPDQGVRLDARRTDLARGVALADENAEHQLRAMLNDTPTQGPLLELVRGNRYRLAGEDARTLSAPRFRRGSR